MTLRRSDWLFVLTVVLVGLLVSLLPSPRDRNPMIPDTPDHRSLASEKTAYGVIPLEEPGLYPTAILSGRIALTAIRPPKSEGRAGETSLHQGHGRA